MNLIYSLAYEAGLIKFESVHDSMAVTPSLESVAKAQKFAELIIRECIRVSDETGTSSLISDRIAERFGFRS